MLHHSQLAHTKCTDFHGCEEVLQKALLMIESPAYVEQTVDYSNLFGCIALCIVGKSGSGKTALMAKLGALIVKAQGHSHETPTRPVIVRFCGTSTQSVTGRALITSICRQIEYVYNLSHNSLATLSYSEVVTYFLTLLVDWPIVLFLDGLDQLSDTDQTRSKLSFFNGLHRPHEHTRIIVSTAIDLRDEATGTWVECFMCDTVLASHDVPRITLSSDTLSDATECEHIITSLLNRQKRTLTVSQWNYVRNAISIEPTPLYAALAAKVVSMWPSYAVVGDDTSRHLAGGVSALINQLFDTLQRDYGAILVKAVVAFFSLSVAGISDDELVDLLSCDDAVLGSVFQYSKALSPRLPMHVWIRLRGELADFLVEQESHCLVWSHRMLKQTALSRYSDTELCHYQVTLARYFGNIVSSEVMAERKLAASPYIVTDEHGHSKPFYDKQSVVNKRRCIEAAHHLIAAHMYRDAVLELCSIQGVVCRLRVGLRAQLVNELSALSSLLSTVATTADPTHIHGNRVDHYLRWLLVNGSLMSTDTIDHFVAFALSQPYSSAVRQDTLAYLHSVLADEGTCLTINNGFDYSPATAEHTWLRGKVLGSAHLFSPLTMKVGEARVTPLITQLNSGKRPVDQLAWSADGSELAFSFRETHCEEVYILNACNGDVRLKLHWKQGLFRSSSQVCALAWNNDTSSRRLLASADRSRYWDETDDNIRIWDVISGANVLSWSVPGVMCICWCGDNTRLCSGSADKSLSVWDAHTSMQLYSLADAHSDEITTVQWSSDSKTIYSGSKDANIKLWGDADLTLLCNTSIAPGAEGIKHNKPIQQVVCNANGTLFASCGEEFDGAIRVFNVRDRVWLPLLKGHNAIIVSIGWCHSGGSAQNKTAQSNVLASCSHDRLIHLWSVSNEASVASTILHTIDELDSNLTSYTALVWRPGRDEIAVGCTDDVVRVFSIPVSVISGTAVAPAECAAIGIEDALNYSCQEEFDTRSLGGTVSALTWTTDDNKLISNSDFLMRVWNTDTCNTVCNVAVVGSPCAVFCGANGAVKIAVNFSVDELFGVGIHNFTTGHRVNSQGSGYNSCIRCMSWNHSGSKLASGDESGMILIWDGSTAALLFVLINYSTEGRCVQALCWVNDDTDRLLAVRCKEVVQEVDWKDLSMWSGATGDALWHYSSSAHVGGGVKIQVNHCNTRYSFNNDHSRVYLSNSLECPIADSSYSVLELPVQYGIDAVVTCSGLSWHTDNIRLAAAYSVGFVAIWNTVDCSLCTVLHEKISPSIVSVCWNRQGDMLAGGCVDGLIYVWDCVQLVDRHADNHDVVITTGCTTSSGGVGSYHQYLQEQHKQDTDWSSHLFLIPQKEQETSSQTEVESNSKASSCLSLIPYLSKPPPSFSEFNPRLVFTSPQYHKFIASSYRWQSFGVTPPQHSDCCPESLMQAGNIAIKSDPTAALALFQQSLLLDNSAKTHYVIACTLMRSPGAAVTDAVVDHWKQAAHGGLASACVMMAKYHTLLKPDTKKAKLYLEHGAKLGNSVCQYELSMRIAIDAGSAPLNGEQKKLCVHYMTEAARQFHRDALVRLGKWYLQGPICTSINMNCDYALAFKYLSQATVVDNPAALFYLSKMYREGLGVEVDMVKADGFMQLAVMYGCGDGV